MYGVLAALLEQEVFMFGSLSNFQQRFVCGFLGILIITAIIFVSHVPPFHYLFIASVALVQIIALWEYYQLAKEKEIIPQVALGVIFSLLYVILHYLKVRDALALFLFAFMAVAFMKCCRTQVNALANIATTIFGFVYVTIPLSFLIDLNFPKTPCSSFWIIYLIAITKITDTSAYIAGKTCGKHYFAPVLSPKKTWEGAIAGLFGSSVTSVFFFIAAARLGYVEGSSFSLFESALLGLAIGFFAQMGDLAESLLKRDANVKDSNKLPGFGGFLDIVDSLIFTTPLLFFWLKMKDML